MQWVTDFYLPYTRQKDTFLLFPSTGRRGFSNSHFKECGNPSRPSESKSSAPVALIHVCVLLGSSWCQFKLCIFILNSLFGSDYQRFFFFWMQLLITFSHIFKDFLMLFLQWDGNLSALPCSLEPTDILLNSVLCNRLPTQPHCVLRWNPLLTFWIQGFFLFACSVF